MTYENVAKLMELPDLDDMDFDPAGVYQQLTGKENDDASTQDCMAVVLKMVTKKVQALSKRTEGSGNSGQTYSYVETDFIKALKNGYVIEAVVAPGNIHDSVAFDDIYDKVTQTFPKIETIVADSAYKTPHSCKKHLTMAKYCSPPTSVP